MDTHAEGCLVCGKPLVYHEEAKPFPCHVCGATSSTNAVCEEGHFVCDSCHAAPAFGVITRHARETRSANPISIATELMKHPSINMHGPEHHYLVPAALLAAYKNAGGGIDLEAALRSAGQRAGNVPGGICGMWGCCGAAVGSGIFISVISGATPLSEAAWSLSNQMTSRSLAAIAANGGPRCCKRDTYLAILQAVEFAKERFGVAMESQETIACQFSRRNGQCRRGKCPYYPFECH